MSVDWSGFTQCIPMAVYYLDPSVWGGIYWVPPTNGPGGVSLQQEDALGPGKQESGNGRPGSLQGLIGRQAGEMPRAETKGSEPAGRGKMRVNSPVSEEPLPLTLLLSQPLPGLGGSQL